MKLKKFIYCVIIFIIIQNIIINLVYGAETDNNSSSQRIILNNFTNYSEDVNPISEDIESETDEEEMKIYSEAAILIEEKTGKILYEKNIHDRKYPASTTKILTAIIALENCDMNETQIATDSAVNVVKSGYSTAGIKVGETFTIGELIDVMMIHSANEAANIIAEHISGSISEFANLMNQKAKEIGCIESNFVNPNGMHDENHYSSAYDLAMIARYCMQNEEFRKIVVKMECSLPATELCQEERKFKNTNSLLLSDNKYYYPYCNGIKTGFTTPAKNCLISSSNKDGFETIAVVLHAESTDEGTSARYTDTIKLFDYGYANYNYDDILEEYDMIDYAEDETESVIEKTEDMITLAGIITDYDNTDNNSSGKETIYIKGYLEIGIGIIILLTMMIYYLIKKFKKNRRKTKGRDLYNFKLN